MPTLLCLAALATLASLATAQETFHDADFSFSFTPPEGMVLLGDEEVRTFYKLPAELPFNPPLTDDRTRDVVHNFLWKDPTGEAREIKLLISFSPKGLPWVRPEDYVESVEHDAQIVIDTREPLKAPHPGILVEGSALNNDGVEVRRILAYFTMGRNEYAIMSLSAHASDWPVRRAELAAALDSVRFPMPEGAATGKPGAGGSGGGRPGGRKPQGGQADIRQAADGGPTEKWSSLEVSGSLVLAVVLLMGLFAGGKRPS